mmetsp:Transcript_5490/g.9184  ORF Transcript_5490/g.9184 Transcript_5490/m.9184 type:complete len:410 (+) Transcript_5490:11-1240(+)
MADFDILGQLDLSNDQKEMILKLRAEMKIPEDAPFDGVQDDLALYRFLKAKKWDFEVAKKQYQAMRKYREDEKVAKIFEWAQEKEDLVELIDSLFPYKLSGYDKGGRPILYEDLGSIPASRFAKLVTREQNHKHHTMFMENLMRKLLEASKKEKRPIFQTTVVVDMGGSSMESRHFVPYFKDMSQQDEQNYPEIVNAVFVVNSPWVFPYLYGLVKHFIDPNTREKVRVYSSGYEKELLKEIDVKTLNIKYGGENNEELPTVRGVKMKNRDEEMTSKNVAARDSLEVVNACEDKKGGKFEWVFKLDDLDIDFKVEWKGAKDKNPKTLIDESRITQHSGEYVAKGIGELKITFNNTYSYLTSKDVNYAVIYNSMEKLKAQADIERRQEKQAKKAEKEARKLAKKKEKKNKN